MSMTVKELIDSLNKDLEKEYAAAIQYINHATTMTGAEFGDIIKELQLTGQLKQLQKAKTGFYLLWQQELEKLILLFKLCGG